MQMVQTRLCPITTRLILRFPLILLIFFPLCSEVIPSPSPDIVRLLQQGVQHAMYWQIEATVVLDLHPVTTRVRA